MVETTSAPITIDMGKNLAFPIEVQEARDPNLCHWAEYYFLSRLSHAFLSEEDLPVLEGHAMFEGQDIICHLLQKTDMENVPYMDRTLARVKLGQPTALILDGPLEDFIVIPSGDRNFSVGRLFGDGINSVNKLHNQIWGESQNNEYLHAAYLRIQQAKQFAKAAGTPISSDYDLYQYLKAKIVARLKATKEAA